MGCNYLEKWMFMYWNYTSIVLDALKGFRSMSIPKSDAEKVCSFLWYISNYWSTRRYLDCIFLFLVYDGLFDEKSQCGKYDNEVFVMLTLCAAMWHNALMIR